MMKQFLIGALALVAITDAQDDVEIDVIEGEEGEIIEQADPSSACLYCRNEDKDAGFLTSYSFCEH